MTVDIDPYLPMADRIARSYKKRLPPQICFDDLRQAARIGAWDAVRKHPDALTDKYIKARIRGSVLDELRAQDWLPRRARQKEGHATVISIEDVNDATGKPFEPVSDIESPECSAERMLTKKRLAPALASLTSPQEIDSVHKVFFLDRSTSSVAAQEGVSQPAISLRLSRAVDSMRRNLDPSVPSLIRQPLTDEEILEVVRLKGNGLSAREIARRIGHTAQQVSDAVSRPRPLRKCGR